MKHLFAGVLALCFIVLIFCIPGIIGSFMEQSVYVTKDVDEYTIITESAKHCWVVKRSANGLVEETFFHSEDLDECRHWITNN